MTSQRPQSTSRNKYAYRTRAIPTMARKKGPSGGGVFFAILVMAGLFVGMLFLLDILPFGRPATPTPTNALSQSVSTELTNATAVDLPTATEQPTQTLTPTETPEPTATSTAEPTMTPAPTEKPMPYIVRGIPMAYQSKLFRTESTCATYYIAGMVVDLQESPVHNLTVKLGGTYGGDIVDFETSSGDARLYGESGFEFAFANKKINEDRVYIQLLDRFGEALSRTYLDISGSCDHNLLNVTLSRFAKQHCIFGLITTI